MARGLLDDHLPNRVLAALKRYQKNLKANGYMEMAKERRQDPYRHRSSVSEEFVDC